MPISSPAEKAIDEVKESSADLAIGAARLLIQSLQPADYIGGGAERQVFALDEKRVAAFFPKMGRDPSQIPKELKSYYYASKLAHLLLPDNFPDVYLAASQPPMMIAERIRAGAESDSDDRYGFRRQLERLGWTEAVDYNSSNFAKDDKGNVVYLDIITPEKLLTPEFREYCAILDDDVLMKVKGLQAKIIRNLVG